ncbi:hypothetical protein ABZX92_04875 [Lentzea sp. NPDC006480]|uniref:hypothetical protein n=1 Tax=Lentzea sp. NPDC006480 TaxID=3157176 RepID=UPI0033B0CCA8
MTLPRRSLFALPAVALLATPAHAAPAWTQKPFTYKIQKPYNLPESARYKFEGGVHSMWVFDNDKPLSEGSKTDPRTEMRWDQEYSSGQHAWEGEIYVPSGVNGPTVMQILRVGGGDPGTPATDFMINATNANGGTLRYYTSTVIASGIYNKWVRIRVEHSAVSGGTGKIKVFANGVLKATVSDRGKATRHFKNGVYHHGSGRAEARFRNITYWTQ